MRVGKRNYTPKYLVRRLFNRIVMQRHVQKMLLPFGRKLNPDRWIFVVGCYNSATTLLANILRKHPLMEGLLTEGAYLTDVLPYPEQYGWPRMWCKCIDDIRLQPGPGGKERAERIKRHLSIWYPKNIPNLVEKSVSNAVRLHFLDAYFKPAYFIYIVRNGYTVAHGIRKKANLSRWNNEYQNDRYPIELCAEQWRISDEIIEQDSKSVKNFMRIYYEDLTGNPEKILSAITDFLELPPYSRDVLSNEWEIDGVISPMRNMNSDVLDKLSYDDINKIELVARKELLKHGYKRPK